MTFPQMTIPDEVEQRLRDYFAALLPPHAAHAAVADVLDWLPVNASPTTVFFAAHKALQGRIRVQLEVEADVLIEEGGLSVSDVATVLGLRERDVREALDAAAEAAAALDRSLGKPVSPPGGGTGAATLDRSRSEPAIARGSGTGATEALDRSMSAPALARGNGTGATAALDQSISGPAVAPGSRTDSVGGDATEQRVVVVVEEEVPAENLERIERSRAGAVIVLVLALIIAVAALVVAAQGT